VLITIQSLAVRGANDNGSGVAALLELSRLFQDVAPETSLRFVAFVNEEPPFFSGPAWAAWCMPKPPGNGVIRYVL
jgi:Peptidase family M28.